MAQAVLRALDVIGRVAADPEGMTYSRIETACKDIAPATLARLVKFLAGAGLLSRGRDGSYAVGPAAMAFARKVQTAAVPRGELARPAVTALAEATAESAAYYEMDGETIVLRTKEERPNSFHYIDVGHRTGSLHTHLFSQAMTAFRGKEAVGAIVQSEKLNLRQAAQLKQRLQVVAKEGCALGPEDANVSISRAAAPVYGADGTIVGAIGVTALGRDLPAKRLAALAREAKRAAKEITGIFRGQGI